MKQRPPFDIRVYKKDLRARYKAVRTDMSPEVKAEKDAHIFQRLTAMSQYRQAKTLLIFVSTAIEVDTHKIIQHALDAGKRVAVPYCVPGTRNMEFYEISSMDELSPGTFGVLEPLPEKNRRVTQFAESVCVLPGLSFDRKGYRLGYGGGYYDRFLSGQYTVGTTVGICYADCVCRHLIHGKYDVPCKWLVTDTGVHRIMVRKDPAAQKSVKPRRKGRGREKDIDAKKQGLQ